MYNGIGMVHLEESQGQQVLRGVFEMRKGTSCACFLMELGLGIRMKLRFWLF